MVNLNNILENIIYDNLYPVIQRSDGLYQILQDITPGDAAGVNLNASFFDVLTDETHIIRIIGTWDSTYYGYNYNKDKWDFAENIPEEPIVS